MAKTATGSSAHACRRPGVGGMTEAANETAAVDHTHVSARARDPQGRAPGRGAAALATRAAAPKMRAMLRLVLHLALIALLSLEGASLRAAALPAPGLEVHLCSGGAAVLPGDPAEPPHRNCLDCCLVTLAAPPAPPQAPARRLCAARLRRRARGRSRAGRPAAPSRARDPPQPFA